MNLVLSLFPGIGLLDMAFEEEGFCVVRGPDLLWGGDVRTFHPPAHKFDGVIGGPPCQAFSRLRHIVEANGYQTAPNLIPEFERVVSEAGPSWFLMENVPDAPMPRVSCYFNQAAIVCDHWVGGETSRERRFTYGATERFAGRFEVETLALHIPDPARAVTCDARQGPVAIGGSGKRKGLGGDLPRSGKAESIDTMAELQGLPSEFIARLREHGAFTSSAIKRGIGNGVPLPMGRAVAKAVKKASRLRPSHYHAAAAEQPCCEGVNP
jgi:DNA (cytosine-5)-methyltransferase 1